MDREGFSIHKLREAIWLERGHWKKGKSFMGWQNWKKQANFAIFFLTCGRKMIGASTENSYLAFPVHACPPGAKAVSV